jgi:hypothetical protein
MHSAAIRRSTGLAAALALCGGLGLAGAAARAGEDPGQVTSVIGDTRAGGTQLAGGASIGEREHVATGEGGKCSMLVDDDVVVQLCERTKLVLRSDPGQGRRILQVDAGSVHVIAAPRLAQERVEIHTPAAIAILLGTIVHVAVDPDTGDSTITSTESAVRVRSASERFDQETTLNPAQQITVRSGAPPPAQPQRLGRRQLAQLDICIADLREAALEGGRGDLVDDTITRMAEAEVPRGGLPGLGRPAPDRQTPRPEDPLPGDDPNDLENLCNPLECADYGGQRGGQFLVAE